MTTTTEATCTCQFCYRTTTEELAVHYGWQPYFYLDETTESKGPCCPACAVDHLDDLADEPIIKPGHTVPDGPIPVGQLKIGGRTTLGKVTVEYLPTRYFTIRWAAGDREFIELVHPWKILVRLKEINSA